MKERRCQVCFLILIIVMILLCSACASGDYSDRTRYIYIERDSSWFHTPSHYYHHDHHNYNRHIRRNHQDNISRPSSRPSRPNPTSVYPPPASNPNRAPVGKSPHDP